MGAHHHTRDVHVLVDHRWLLTSKLPIGDPVGFAVTEAAPEDGAYAIVSQAVSSAMGLRDQVPRAADFAGCRSGDRSCSRSTRQHGHSTDC